METVPRANPDLDQAFSLIRSKSPLDLRVGSFTTGNIQWRILSTGNRERLTELPTVIHVIANLEFYRLAN